MTTFERCYTTIKFQIRMYTIAMSIWLVYNYVSRPLVSCWMSDHSMDLLPPVYVYSLNMNNTMCINSGNTSNGQVNINLTCLQIDVETDDNITSNKRMRKYVHFATNVSITVASSNWGFHEYLGRSPPIIWWNSTNNTTISDSILSFYWLFDELLIVNETEMQPFSITLMPGYDYVPTDDSEVEDDFDWIFGIGSNITNASRLHNFYYYYNVSMLPNDSVLLEVNFEQCNLTRIYIFDSIFDIDVIYIVSNEIEIEIDFVIGSLSSSVSINNVFDLSSSDHVYRPLSYIQPQSAVIKNSFDKIIMKFMLVGGTLAYLVINFIFVALFVIVRVRGMLGHNKHYIRVINPLNIDHTLQSRQHTNNELRKFVMSWNKQPKRTNVNVNNVVKCFQNNHIDDEYFQTHTRKEFMELVKKQCHVKASAAAALWKHFKNKNTNAFNNVCHVNKQTKKELDVVAEIVNNLKKEIENSITAPNYLDVIVEILSDTEQLKNIINVTKWETISTFCNKSKHAVSFILSIEKSEFAKRCIDCMIIHQNNIQLIPILVFDCNQNKNCVYYVSIVRIIEDSDIGIAFEYHTMSQTISVRGIYLDKDGIQERNAFILPYRTYICLDNFVSNITQLNIGRYDQNK